MASFPDLPASSSWSLAVCKYELGESCKRSKTGGGKAWERGYCRLPLYLYSQEIWARGGVLRFVSEPTAHTCGHVCVEVALEFLGSRRVSVKKHAFRFYKVGGEAFVLGMRGAYGLCRGCLSLLWVLEICFHAPFVIDQDETRLLVWLSASKLWLRFPRNCILSV